MKTVRMYDAHNGNSEQHTLNLVRMPDVQNEGENYLRVAQSSKEEEVPVEGSECEERESTAHLSGPSLEIGGGEEHLP